jgi:hypothetical protein
LFFLIKYDVSPLTVLKSFFPEGYIGRGPLLPMTIKVVSIEHSWLLLLPGLYLLTFCKVHHKIIIPLSFILSFLPVLSIRDFAHYVGLLLPYIYILFAYFSNYLLKRHRLYLILIMTLLSFIIVRSYRYSDREIDLAAKNLDLETGMISRSLWNKKPVLVLANPKYYYLCNFHPLELKPLGYRFLSNHSPEDLSDLFHLSSRIFFDTKDIWYAQTEIKRFEEHNDLVFSEFLNRDFVKIKSIPPSIELWQKKGSIKK